MQKHTMVIDDQPGLKITDLRARARRMKESYGIRLLVIDYLQLIAGSGSARTMENRQNEISEISRMLKTLRPRAQYSHHLRLSAFPKSGGPSRPPPHDERPS